MYSTVRYPRALRFTAENKLLRPSKKGGVSPQIQLARIPSQCPSTILAARATSLCGSLGYPPHRVGPKAAVSEQLHCLLGIPPLLDASEHLQG
jgi:hypothetical protein